MFKDILFWCEFPEEVNWKRVNVLLKDKTCGLYIAASSRAEFEMIKKKITAPHVRIGVWPTLSKEKGYWFSSFTNKKDFEKLKEFSGIPMKIDIEPPIFPSEYTAFAAGWWLLEHSVLRTGQNKEEFHRVIKELMQENEVILSGFALPEWMRARYGDPVNVKTKRNFICYSSFFPLGFLAPVGWAYYDYFLKKYPDSYAAIGLANHGIFENEPEYESIEQFKDDVAHLKEMKHKNIVVYSIEGIAKRADADEWLRILFE